MNSQVSYILFPCFFTLFHIIFVCDPHQFFLVHNLLIILFIFEVSGNLIVIYSLLLQYIVILRKFEISEVFLKICIWFLHHVKVAIDVFT